LDSHGIVNRKWKNDNPKLRTTGWKSHGSAVSMLTEKGFTVLGYGQVRGPEIIDAENARLLAIEKNADVAIFSAQDFEVSHEERNFKLFDHKTTLLRSRSKAATVPKLQKFDSKRNDPKTTTPRPERYYLG
jgi:hypothetical protein